jgi:hypothetical protein
MYRRLFSNGLVVSDQEFEAKVDLRNKTRVHSVPSTSRIQTGQVFFWCGVGYNKCIVWNEKHWKRGWS